MYMLPTLPVQQHFINETGFLPSTSCTVYRPRDRAFVVLQAGIEKLHIKGRIRITFDPLVPKLPVIGAIKVLIPLNQLSNGGLCRSRLYQHFAQICTRSIGYITDKMLL